MMDKKKPGMAVLIALKKMGKGQEEGPDKHAEVAQELLDAIKADDAKEFGRLLHEYVLMCMDDAEAPEEPEKDMEEEKPY